jgi:hypothetical protein
MEEQEAKIQVVHTVVSAEWQNAHTHLPWVHGRTESPSNTNIHVHDEEIHKPGEEVTSYPVNPVSGNS